MSKCGHCGSVTNNHSPGCPGFQEGRLRIKVEQLEADRREFAELICLYDDMAKSRKDINNPYAPRDLLSLRKELKGKKLVIQKARVLLKDETKRDE